MFQFGSNSYATVALQIHLMYLISPLHNHLSVLIGLFLCGEGFQRAMETFQLLISHLKEVILKMSSTYIIVIVLCSHLPPAVRMVAASMFLLVSFLPLNLPFLFHCVCVYFYSDSAYQRDNVMIQSIIFYLKWSLVPSMFLQMKEFHYSLRLDITHCTYVLHFIDLFIFCWESWRIHIKKIWIVIW